MKDERKMQEGWAVIEGNEGGQEVKAEKLSGRKKTMRRGGEPVAALEESLAVVEEAVGKFLEHAVESVALEVTEEERIVEEPRKKTFYRIGEELPYWLL